MKWLIIALLLVNGVAYFWLSGAQKQRLARESRPPGVYIREHDSLVLVSERQADSQRVTVNSGNCLLLGSFSSSAKARELAAVMALGGVSALPRELVDNATSGFWVYIAAPDQGNELETLRASLSAAQIDSFVFREGELQGNISLGFFASYQNALNQQVELKRLGFSAEIVSSASVNRSNWLEISKDAEHKVEEKFWPMLVLASLAGEVEQRPCVQGEISAKKPD